VLGRRCSPTCTAPLLRRVPSFLRWVGFEPPVAGVLDWMNTGLLSVGGVFSSDNELITSPSVKLTLNHLADAGRSGDRWDLNPQIVGLIVQFSTVGGSEGTLHHMMTGLLSKRLNSWQLLRPNPAPLRTDHACWLAAIRKVHSFCGGSIRTPLKQFTTYSEGSSLESTTYKNEARDQTRIKDSPRYLNSVISVADNHYL
jgi:hypothetical protein